MAKRHPLFLLLSLILLAACQPITPTMEPQTTFPTEPPTIAATNTLETSSEEPMPADETESAPTPTQPSTEFLPVVQLEPVASGFTAPVDLDAPNDGSGRLFVTDQVGLVYVINGEGNLLEKPFLDLQNQLVNLNRNYDERGLLGLAFHPEYAENGRVFVYYSAPLQAGAPAGFDHTSILSEFTVFEEDPNRADPDSERIIMRIDQPQSNHNAGAIAFSPADGYLYIPLGDGGAGSDRGPGHAEDWYETNAGGNGQDVEDNLHGSILRIDIDNGDPYSVPGDNPNISQTYPEIWAYGFRNPYRMAFDPAGEHQLFLGDAGQELFEEVSIVEAGGNYGWNVREGFHCFSTAAPGDPDAITDCPTQDPEGVPLTDPILEFRNTKHPEGGLGTSVIGGVVYRGSSLPAWDGRYIFGQWSRSAGTPSGGMFVAAPNQDGLWKFQNIEIPDREGGELNEFLLGFGNDQAGEVYVLTSLSLGPRGNSGSVYRIIPPQS
jgi:glucose/arabinose dehydrogenase